MKFLERVTPCLHMTELLSRHADGSLSGMTRWFVGQHVKGCDHCGEAYEALVGLRERLARLHDPPTADRLDDTHRAALEAALDSVENPR
jgi:anti-sigma factor ChrR (cupin superfamily)